MRHQPTRISSMALLRNQHAATGNKTKKNLKHLKSLTPPPFSHFFPSPQIFLDKKCPFDSCICKCLSQDLQSQGFQTPVNSPYALIQQTTSLSCWGSTQAQQEMTAFIGNTTHAEDYQQETKAHQLLIGCHIYTSINWYSLMLPGKGKHDAIVEKNTKAIININKEGFNKLNILSIMLLPKKIPEEDPKTQKTKNFYCHEHFVKHGKEAVYGTYCILISTSPHAKLSEWLDFNWFLFILWSQNHRSQWSRTADTSKLAPPLQMVLLQNQQLVPIEQGEHSDCYHTKEHSSKTDTGFF